MTVYQSIGERAIRQIKLHKITGRGGFKHNHLYRTKPVLMKLMLKTHQLHIGARVEYLGKQYRLLPAITYFHGWVFRANPISFHPLLTYNYVVEHELRGYRPLYLTEKIKVLSV